jgi:hypothetical protein
MLRRQPTAIKLTSNDLAAYEDWKRSQEQAALLAAQQKSRSSSASASAIHQGALNPLDARMRQRGRDERIGISSGSGGMIGANPNPKRGEVGEEEEEEEEEEDQEEDQEDEDEETEESEHSSATG